MHLPLLKFLENVKMYIIIIGSLDHIPNLSRFFSTYAMHLYTVHLFRTDVVRSLSSVVAQCHSRAKGG